ncbi:hypothetical protein KCU99_g6021, partial [Aureobasidium melanogenum]
MATYNRCASGPCRTVGTLKIRCAYCKTTYYCSKACATEHWEEKHKLTCDGPDAFSPLRSGIFNFMGLPREVRNKIYDEVLASRLPASDQAEYDRVAATISNGQHDLAISLDKYGQRLNKHAEWFRDMAKKHPDTAETCLNQARFEEQIFSTRASAIRKVAMLGPPSSDPEYARLMALARSI